MQRIVHQGLHFQNCSADFECTYFTQYCTMKCVNMQYAMKTKVLEYHSLELVVKGDREKNAKKRGMEGYSLT